MLAQPPGKILLWECCLPICTDQFLPLICYCVCFFVHIMYFPLFLLCCNASAFVICAIKNYLLSYLTFFTPISPWTNAPNTVSSFTAAATSRCCGKPHICLLLARAIRAAVAQPKSTEVPHYPHNYLAIPVFVHRIVLPLAIHWQQSFVQNMAKVCGTQVHHSVAGKHVQNTIIHVVDHVVAWA